MASTGRGSKNHIHKYHHIDITYAKVWACALGDCTHYMPAHLNSLMTGKKSHCWECNKEFFLDEENMKNPEPVCMACANKELLSHLLNYEKR
jgi:DNA-directed RNA polymerase subunit RPC12/RpoP